MRIIAGKWKGRRLAGPKGAGVRPTSDGLRETLFNVLGARIEDVRVLDAYAGTGAVGLEALSRGAREIIFVERDRLVIRGLEDNITACDARSACAIIRDDFLTLRARRPDLGAFEVVIADPPYDVADLAAVATATVAWIAPGGLAVLEHSRRRTSPEAPPGAHRTRVLTAGDSSLSFYSPD